MVRFCLDCGSRVDDNAKSCDKCGTVIKSENQENNSNNNMKDLDEKILVLPLVLGLIGIFIGIVEGLSCPVLFGWENIVTEIVVAIVGGLSGIFLYKKSGDLVVSGIEFIVTGAMMFISINNMAFIGSLIFIATGIVTLYISKKFIISNKKLLVIPVLTIVLVFVCAFMVGFAGGIMTSSLGNSVEINNIQSNITSNYGYYTGDLSGEISIGSDVNYLELDVDYLDANGNVIQSGIGWNCNNVKAKQVYKFNSAYFKKEKPVKAKITVYNSAIDHENPIYTKNINFN